MNNDFDNRSRFAANNDPMRQDFMPDLSSDTPQTLPTPQQRPQAFNPTDNPTPMHAAAFPEPARSTGDPNADAEREESPMMPPAPLPTVKQPKRPKRPNKISIWFRGLDKKKKALVIALAVWLIAGLLFAAYWFVFRNEEEAPAPPPATSTTKPAPSTVASPLTGRQVKPEDAKKQVIAAIIENSREARPQAGLQEAGVVFEAIAEGGITRFMALYQDTAPGSIGPVRSLRPYYLSWAMGFDAAVAHVGGSPEALQNVKDWGSKDLDQMSHPGPFDRIRERYAPHNVFTSFDRLNELAASKNYTSSTFKGFERTAKPAPSATPTARTINVNISSAFYNSSYTYDPATNTYARSMAGAPHNDNATGKQITPDVVVAMVMNYGIQSDGKHSVYNTVGSGKVFVFQNGTVAEGTWQKTSHDSNIEFRDGSGRLLSINPGQTWITAVNSSSSVTYQP